MRPMKELTTVLLGIIAITLVIAFGWLLFHGVYRLGSNIETLLHWQLNSECTPADDELICRGPTWLVGFASLMVIPFLWCAGLIMRLGVKRLWR
jgi:hypothetical protein